MVPLEDWARLPTHPIQLDLTTPTPPTRLIPVSILIATELLVTLQAQAALVLDSTAQLARTLVPPEV
jgi:hypothetical protein